MGSMSKRSRNLQIFSSVCILAAFAAFTLLWTQNTGASLIHNKRHVHITVTVSEIKSVPKPTPKVEKPIKYVEKPTKRLEISSLNTRAEKKSIDGGIPVADGRTLPLLLGVGPAKTSSTALFDSLGQHPEIALGNVSRLGHECCGSELYYFSRRFNNTNPAAGLGAYFSLDSKPNANWLAEKTPEYSDHFLAPYRVRDTLHSKALALVFTIRDPVDAHVSLYFYRMQRKKLKSSAQGFLQWSRDLFKANHAYRNCVEVELLTNKYKEPLSTEFSPRWVGLQHLDEAVFEKCRAQFFKPSDRLEGVGSLEYSHTLPRWKRVFETSGRYFDRNRKHTSKQVNSNTSGGSNGGKTGGKSSSSPVKVPMMCVFHQDFIKNPEKETKKVAKFIGLDPEKLHSNPSSSFEPSGIPSSGNTFEQSAEERVFAAEGAKDRATALALWQHMKRLRGFFSGELEFAEEFCRQLEEKGPISLS